MKNGNQNSASETVCGVDNPKVASEKSANSEVRGVLSQILREGAQKILQSAIQNEVDGYLQNRDDIEGDSAARHTRASSSQSLECGEHFAPHTGRHLRRRCQPHS
jgi:hypothetical protein